METITAIDMNRFSIKDIENLTGVKAHTIRIWEQRYGILKPKRTPTNIRFYDADDLKLALRIAMLNSFGYKISRIHKMTDTDMDGLIQKIADADFKLEIVTNDLLEATLAMDMVRFEAIVNNHIRLHGIAATVEGLIFQFLEKIGLMWMSNRLIPAQEHLASNVLYRKLAIAIDALPIPPSDVKVLLFLPEGEVHEMALMYVQYLLRKAGKMPIYLGPNTPLKEVELVCDAMRPDYVYTHLTSLARDWDSGRYLQKLSKAIRGIQIFVSGSVLQKKSLSGNGDDIRFLHSLEEAQAALCAL